MNESSTAEITLGVTLYSYGGDFCVTMTLEDCLADVAEMGASDVEILADTHIPGYPTPASEWIDEWHAMIDRFGLTPSCYSSWIDTRLHKDRGLTLEEAIERFSRDLELAHRMGFSIIRPKLGVVSLDLIPDPVWRDTVRDVLPKAEEYGIRIAPEIHAPTPLRSRIVDDFLDFARETGTGYFGQRLDRLLQHLDRGLAAALGGDGQRVVDDALGDRALPVQHDLVHDLGDQTGAVDRIRVERSGSDVRASRHAGLRTSSRRTSSAPGGDRRRRRCRARRGSPCSGCPAGR